ncbi:IreB family regulatory phosphoprotein [Natranaerobius thermophilus]
MRYNIPQDDNQEIREILQQVYNALEEKGYNPINQLVGYFMSGDPTYITNHRNARSVIRQRERDELLERILKSYLENNSLS